MRGRVKPQNSLNDKTASDLRITELRARIRVASELEDEKCASSVNAEFSLSSFQRRCFASNTVTEIPYKLQWMR